MQTENINNDKEPIDKGLWLILGTMIFLGIAMVFGFAIGFATTLKYFFTAASTGMLIGGAFFTAGGLGGFLFGIPKLLQNTALIPDSNSSRAVILHNDNLVQISDWLTKIIVGVGLTQLYNIPGYILKVGESLQNSFGGDIIGRNAAIAVILYFVVIGFLSVYIWTRIYFVRLLRDLDDELDPINRLKQKIEDNKEEQENKLKLSDLNNKIERFEGLKNKVINMENNFDGLKDIFKVLKPGPVKWIDDIQKGRWGGKSEVNGIRLYAKFQDSSETFEGRKTYTVSFFVEGSADHPLQGKVYFLLHQSYMPNYMLVVEAENNIASAQVESYEAFTVAAVCENGNTVLELDLNEYPGSPPDYRYADKLVSIDDLLEEKALLLKNQK